MASLRPRLVDGTGRPTGASQHAAITTLLLDGPASAEECSEHARGARAGPVAHAAAKDEGDVEALTRSLVMLEPVGRHPQRQRLHLGDRVILRRPMSQHTRQLHDLGDPATLGLRLELTPVILPLPEDRLSCARANSEGDAGGGPRR